jgi:hypothetical protein
MAEVFGFQVWSMLIISRECQTGTFSSSPLNEELDQDTDQTFVKPSYPCIANTGVSTRLDTNRSLLSGVNEDSRIAPNAGSRYRADLATHNETTAVTVKMENKLHLDMIKGTYDWDLM